MWSLHAVGTLIVAIALFGGSAVGADEFMNLTAAGDRLFFKVRKEGNAEELWVSDGTPEGTRAVRGFLPRSFGEGPMWLTPVAGRLFFAADGGDGTEPWTSDGTQQGTFELADIRPGTEGSHPQRPAALGDRVVFSADDGVHGTELWVSDGTREGTVLIDVVPGREASDPLSFTRLGDRMFFRSGTALWATDGTAAGTVPVKDFPPPLQKVVRYIRAMTPAGGRIFFALRVAPDWVGIPEDPPSVLYTDLWVSDGTPEGTVGVGRFDATEITSLDAVGGRAAFTAGGELWVTEGTLDSTRFLGPGGRFYTAVGGQLFYAADDGAHGEELWVTDGTPEGTRIVMDILPGSGKSSPSWLKALGGLLAFAADDGVHGAELWTSDGTPQGTAMVVDLLPGPGSSSPVWLAAVGGRLFFVADDGVSGNQLYMYSSPSPPWRRGDATADGRLDIADPIAVIGHLFLGGTELSCLDAADADDSGALDITDAISLISYLFLGGGPPPEPFPACGEDTSADDLGCREFPACP